MKNYLKIVDDIKRRISSNEFSVGSKLPTHAELALEYATSRVTISKVINTLSKQGLVVAKRRVGTFVTNNTYILRKIDEPFRVTKIYSQHMHSQIISFEVRECDEDERIQLHLERNSLIYDIIRLRLINEEPAWLEYTIMPVTVIPNVDLNILEKSIYSYIFDELNLSFGKFEKIIRADKADSYDEKYLEFPKGEPILEIEQLAFLKDGRPFELSNTRYPYDKVEFSYSINKLLED
ncbi:MAG: GntR family transcriptional regulator [Streptococcaceae bacterium]|jgi:GntR family transcriptional regulator|nr:GntR family transcriptional regulator [Streptococcaceae bacterium]